jgi:hypothetical protein
MKGGRGIALTKNTTPYFFMKGGRGIAFSERVIL